ncbi:MAG TPA: hypothetical protein VLU46_12990 [Thermoanaerobaculia bacterium]|nr:hypothetical protein [Thermoanaerobaculia bacterium]
MRAQTALAFLLLLTSTAIADDRSLLGKWESLTRGDGNIGSTLQLNADGSLARTLGAMVDSTYTFDGKRLRITSADPDSGKPVTATYAVKVAGDSLLQKNGGGRGVDIEMRRLTPFQLARPIVGTWRYPHPSGTTAFVTFTEDGKQLVRIPLRVDGGSWVAEGNHLTLNVDGTDPVTSEYRLERNMLTLVEGGKEFRYRRVKY